MAKAAFDRHRVAPEGLYIIGTLIDGQFSGQPVEIFIDRETAESFGWIDPPQEIEEDIPPMKKKRRVNKSFKKKLATWNALSASDSNIG